MTEQEMCKAICKAASDKKARDIVTMDMQGLMISPDYFVICSANTATPTTSKKSSPRTALLSATRKAIARATGSF